MELLLLLAYCITFSVCLAVKGWRDTSQPARSAAPLLPQSRPVRVLVIGATGGTGRELVRQALALGYEVTALVRNPAALPSGDMRLHVIEGNVLDPAAVGRAMAGQHAVLSSLGHRRFHYPNRILSQGTQNILHAMNVHGVRRIVSVTSLGIGDSAGRLGLLYTLFLIPFILPFYFWDKARQERIITGSGTQWTIVRPGALTSGAGRGRYRFGRDVGNFIFTDRISRADVAHFMLAQLGDAAFVESAVGVAS